MKYCLSFFISLLLSSLTTIVIAQTPNQHTDGASYYQQKLSEKDFNGFDIKLSSKSVNHKVGMEYEYYDLYLDDNKVLGYVGIVAKKKGGEIVYTNLKLPHTQPSPFRFNDKDLETQVKRSIKKAFEHSLFNLHMPVEVNIASQAATYQGKKYEYKVEYVYMDKGKELTPYYFIQVGLKNSLEYYNVFLNALTNNIDKITPDFHTCSSDMHYANQLAGKQNTSTQAQRHHSQFDASTMLIDGMYHVCALPKETAYDGLETIPDRADYIASPYGWHDTNSEAGPDNEVLTGNNVEVIVDRDGDNNADTIITSPNRQFSAVPDFTKQPLEYVGPSATNSFYIFNQLHDIMYNNGFDESSFNFQKYNYYGEGKGNDHIMVYSQFSADAGAKNNASFRTPEEGLNGVASLLLFDGSNGSYNLEIQSPSFIAGVHKAGLINISFLTTVIDNPLIGELSTFKDEVVPFENACESIETDLTGKIVLIDLSSSGATCNIFDAAENLMKSGVVAALFYSPESDNVQDLDVPYTRNNLPCFIISGETGLLLKNNQYSEKIKLKITLNNEEKPDRDVSYDNTVTVHEFSHGVSNRLVGGGYNTLCLQNPEEMGEGWSDFYAYMLTMNDSNYKDKFRGLGYYVSGRDSSFTIRQKLYSSDLTINNYTYADTKYGGGQTHYIGSIWGTILWDLTQFFIEEYGFNADLINGNGGNRKVIGLVTEALKITPCEPGFVDARNAILEADQILYDGIHQCDIWKIFAQRGVGDKANQNGEKNDDNQEDFSLPPACRDAIVIEKKYTDVIIAGDTVNVNITIQNNRSEDKTIEISDIIPSGCTYLDNSGSIDLKVENNTIKNSSTVVVEAMSKYTFSYQLLTDPNLGSSLVFSEPVDENSLENVIVYDNFNRNNIDSLTIEKKENSENDYIFHANINKDIQEYIIELKDDISLSSVSNPILIFERSHNLKEISQGYIVEYSVDGRNTWLILDNGIKNKYDHKLKPAIIYNTPISKVLSGNEQNWKYSIFDLSPINAEMIALRIRIGSDYRSSISQPEFVNLNNVFVCNKFNYNSEISVSTETDTYSTLAHEEGTFAIKMMSSSVGEEITYQDVVIYPNPVSSELNISSQSPISKISINTLEGKQVMRLNNIQSKEYHISTLDLASGVYILRINNSVGVSSHKIVVIE